MVVQLADAIMPHVIRGTISLTCIAAFVGLLFLGFIAFMRLSTGWSALVRQFPAKNFRKLGRRYSGQSIFFHRKSWNRPFRAGGMFCVEPAEQGLLVTPFFARRAPILITWLDIGNVETGDTLTVHVDCGNDSQMSLNVSADALPLLREKLPAEQFNKKPSLAELIRNRLTRPPGD